MGSAYAVGTIGASGSKIVGNFIGTTASGLVGFAGGGAVGVSFGGSNNTVGGVLPGSRNIIGGEVGISSPTTIGTVVQGNYIGVGVDGSTVLGALSNIPFAISIFNAGPTTIGGSSAAARNVISAADFGVYLVVTGG